jgi:hypothetical protein
VSHTTYFILQTYDENAAYAFKISEAVYQVRSHKNQKEQYTLSHTLDVQIGPNPRTWAYSVKLWGSASGSVAVTPGEIMTASSVDWGDYDDLKTLFELVIPPNNLLRFRDIDGSEHIVIFSGDFAPNLITRDTPVGEGAHYIVNVLLRLAR